MAFLFFASPTKLFKSEALNCSIVNLDKNKNDAMHKPRSFSLVSSSGTCETSNRVQPHSKGPFGLWGQIMAVAPGYCH